MNSLAMLTMNILQNRPEVKNNPKALEYIQVICSGDEAKGQQLANELCQQHGETKESAMDKVKQYFQLQA